MGQKLIKNYKILILFLLMSITALSSNQWIYSQIEKDNLIKSDKYKIDFYESITDFIKTIDEDGSLRNF
jgi:hypothetical protein